MNEFRDLLPEAEKLQREGLRPVQIIGRLTDIAQEMLGFPFVETGGAEGLVVVPDNATIALATGEAIKFEDGVWRYVEAKHD